jgi:hypothetical protein
MLFDVPSSLGGLLSLFGSCFTAPTFETFCGLVVGLVTRIRDGDGDVVCCWVGSELASLSGASVLLAGAMVG